MWREVELRELRVFLVLADELHFRRTAERLGLTQSRVSQSLRGLEAKLGATLLHRTSRRVSLTDAGRRLLADLQPAVRQLDDVLGRAAAASGAVAGTLRLGLLHPNLGGSRLLELLALFEATHPQCRVHVIQLTFDDTFGPLRRGEVDLIVARPPVELSDLIVGPVLSEEPRVVAVARDHPLASRATLSVEDLADYEVMATDSPSVAKERDTFLPSHTPSGRAIPRIDQPTRTIGELAALIARGRIVHPSVPSVADNLGHPDIVTIPLTDLPPAALAFVWHHTNNSPQRRAFTKLAQSSGTTASQGETPPVRLRRG